MLPEPTRDRWQPLRAGLVDLFYYDQEEFWFRDGRLLLRGNNGTGKSKVLALTLPFLLDGELSPHRVEPDADPKKRMEWNLLLGGAHPHPERLGYTWLEFGRTDEDGTTEYRTLGCGLKAVTGKGIARHWFFVTPQRIGAELDLVDATRTALTRDRLAEALGEHGMVYDRAREYRRAVDEALFGLGEQRYSALVDLLIQLRAPQLSKRPSEKALSGALTEALPPLDQAVIADVAEAFRSLEEDRDALAGMAEAHQAAKSFLGHYRRYARVASRRRAAQPRAAQATYEKVNRELDEAANACRTAESALGEAESALSALEDTRIRLQAQDDALRRSPEMRSARELELAAQDATRLARESTRLAQEREHAASQVARRTTMAAAADERATRATDRVEAAHRSAQQAARDSLIERAHAIAVAGDQAPQETQQIADRQQRAVAEVERLIAAAGAANRELTSARERVGELTTQADELAERRQDAQDTVVEQGSQLIADVRHHLATTSELSVADPAAVEAELAVWVESLVGNNPARVAIDAAGHTAAIELARVGSVLDGRENTARSHEIRLTEEIARLEAGEHNAPPAPHTRAPGIREDRAGAPLWQLVDFADDLPDDRRAGIEAALEAAGILDAWISPAGELIAPGTEDVLLRPNSGVEPSDNLASVLRPAVDRTDPHAAQVSDATLAALLRLIGLGVGQGGSWISADGRFRVGVLEGAWQKSTAVYIGRGARDAARHARLVELHAELTGIVDDLAVIASERARLAERHRVLAEEVAAFPDDTALRSAHAVASALRAEQERLALRQSDASAKLTAAAATATAATAELTEVANDLGLPIDPEQLSAVREGLSRYRIALAELWPALRELADATREAEDARDELVSAEEQLVVRAELSEQARQDSAKAEEHHRTLADTVGAAVAELQRRLSEVTEGLRRCVLDRKAADLRRTQAVADKARAEGRQETLAAQLVTATQERAAAAESLRRFAFTGLLTVALPELPVPDPGQEWAPDPTVRLARQIDRELAEVTEDDSTWERVQRRVTDELKTLADTLSRHANSASARLLDEGIVVDVVFQGRTTTAADLAEALATEVGERQRLLDEREREILENHLVNEVASTLQELISAAEARVSLMNSELADRPTSTGMRLRLLWRPVEDGPAGLAAARDRLLRQTSDAWSESDRAAVGTFLQAQIADVRSRDTTGTWLEHLTEALDYRTWHRFVIQRHQNGQWRSATGPASGGERVLAASVPLFAAASSHYASAGNPHAPRLVTLDEAFAGVDDDSRAKCMGLLAAFDLDVVMTSEREWGCYPEVPGLAIAQLSRTEEVAAVLVTPWEWNGRTRERVRSWS